MEKPKKEVKEESLEIEGETYQLSDLYTITEQEPQESESFQVEEHEFQLSLNPLVEKAEERDNVIAQLFEKIVKQNHNGRSHVLVSVRHPESGNEIRLPLMPLHNFTGHMIVNEIGNRMQSAGLGLPLTDGQVCIGIFLKTC